MAKVPTFTRVGADMLARYLTSLVNSKIFTCLNMFFSLQMISGTDVASTSVSLSPSYSTQSFSCMAVASDVLRCNADPDGDVYEGEFVAGR